jgi:hypothetical protein
MYTMCSKSLLILIMTKFQTQLAIIYAQGMQECSGGELGV